VKVTILAAGLIAGQAKKKSSELPEDFSAVE